jgi:hypothetical protein
MAAVSLVGLLAQFGRGMVQDVTDQLVEQFTVRMKNRLTAQAPAPRAPDPAPAPVDVLSVGSQAVIRSAVRALRGLFRRTGS